MKKNQFLKESDVTAESVFFMKRRQVLKALGISAAAFSLPHAAHADLLSWFKGNDRPPAPAGKPLEFSKPAAWQNNLPLTPADKVSGYNNFYEFGLDKADPAANAGSLKTDPWTLKISGEVAKPLLELGVNNLALLGKELITRPYLTLGIISWVILLALAFTSTQSMQRKLGKHWQQLHNFVYLVAILAPIHYLWSVKIISPQPLIYAGLAVLLLALRYKKLLSLFNRLRKQAHNKLSL